MKKLQLAFATMALFSSLSAMALNQTWPLTDSRGVSCPTSMHVKFDHSALVNSVYALDLPVTIINDITSEKITVNIPLVYEFLTDYVVQYHSKMDNLSEEQLTVNNMNFAIRQFAVLGKDESTRYKWWKMGIQLESSDHSHTCLYTVNWSVGGFLGQVKH